VRCDERTGEGANWNHWQPREQNTQRPHHWPSRITLRPRPQILGKDSWHSRPGTAAGRSDPHFCARCWAILRPAVSWGRSGCLIPKGIRCGQGMRNGWAGFSPRVKRRDPVIRARRREHAG
jgi:hypothetical protein